MFNLSLSQYKDKLPILFIGILIAFITSLYAVNFSAIQEKLGLDTRTTALVKLENANNEIAQLKAANIRLLKELETQNKIQLITANVIRQLDDDNALVLETMLRIENVKQVALAQVDSTEYIDDYFKKPNDQYELPVETPDTVDAPTTNTTVPQTAPAKTDIAPAKTDVTPPLPKVEKTIPPKTTVTKPATVAKSKTDAVSKVQITALWDTYNSLHAG
jgi:hypothetical protein